MACNPAPYRRSLCVAVYTELIELYRPNLGPLLLTFPPHRVRYNSNIVPTKQCQGSGTKYILNDLYFIINCINLYNVIVPETADVN